MIRATLLAVLTASLAPLFVAPTAAAKPPAPAFQCLPGMKNPVRLVAGQVQCASYDATNCLGACIMQSPGPWKPPPAPQRPLACGDAHVAKYGTDGYSQADHWCAAACNGLPDCTAGFVCLPGITTPVRFAATGPTARDVSCASTDGANCLWDTCPAGIKKPTPWHPPAVAALKPLVCGADHAKKYGVDGYGQADHWCKKACKALKCGK